jgi:anti-sigma regulatory factor (Ser/Thr protein kinase)
MHKWTKAGKEDIRVNTDTHSLRRYSEAAVYRGLDAVAAPLSEPPEVAIQVPFDGTALPTLRAFVAHHAARAALRGSKVDEMVFAVNEIASNSVCHGGGRGVLRMWDDGDAFICEIRDDGQILESLADRQLPPADTTSGRGLWLVNHLCDLVQIRSSAAGTVVRLHALRAR